MRREGNGNRIRVRKHQKASWFSGSVFCRYPYAARCRPTGLKADSALTRDVAHGRLIRRRPATRSPLRTSMDMEFDQSARLTYSSHSTSRRVTVLLSCARRSGTRTRAKARERKQPTVSIPRLDRVTVGSRGRTNSSSSWAKPPCERSATQTTSVSINTRGPRAYATGLYDVTLFRGL
jgi:hypothetical protein